MDRAPLLGPRLATEAGRALIDIARALRLPRLEASHFVDNPASGRVLEKLGFEPTGLSAPRYSCARGGEALTRLFRLSLAGGRLAAGGRRATGGVTRASASARGGRTSRPLRRGA